MLKALELVGFKSFADKTRFEFPSGITVVVGPNGSGKSNIVDAVKWVLGEQSVKSLRGKEMADVIFNGSGARRGMNSAEITLTLDNSGNLLAMDTPDVHITRRVYRSGEGEYLINRQPCRLRDIRDLLSGTGLGTNAYSVIEQGKVDVLLQSSSRDRRVIFEEAAGISRFKAKKIEALRRLDRVQQNLLRLSDIVDEVDNRLRGIRAQASKARRYKEHTDRLQELRTQVALVDWHRLTERMARFEAELEVLGGGRDALLAEGEATEAQLMEAETRISDTTEAIRQSEARIADNRERIAGGESTIAHERSRSRDLEQEIARHRRQLATMSVRAGDLREQLRQTGEAVETAEGHHRQIARRLVEGERELTELITQLDQIRGESEQRRTAYMEHMRAGASLGNRISGLESQVAAALAARERIHRRMVELDGQLTSLGGELEALRQQRQELSLQLQRQQQRLSAAKDQLAEHQRQLDQRQSELAQLRQRHGAVAERASVLEELQRRQEGLSAGVKEVLAHARSDTDGPFRQVRGMVADLLNVSVEAAPLVEVALGDVAQHVVVASANDMLEYLRNESYHFAGRVGFVWMDGPEDNSSELDPNLEGRPGVLGRADRFVQTQPQFLPLARKLLGGTWIVEKLGHALELAESTGGRVSFVTLAGELLRADGTLSVGPRHASTGLISRRSELRVLEQQLAELQTKIRQQQTAVEQLEQTITQQAQQVETIAEGRQRAADVLGEHCHKITAAEERQTQLSRQRTVLESELRAAIGQHDSDCEALAGSREEQRQVESELAEMEARLAGSAEKVRRLEADRQIRERRTTESKVELAKSEERLRNLRDSMRQFEESQQERHRTIAESREQLARCSWRAGQSSRDILRAESEIAELYLRKEAFAAGTVELIDRRDVVRQERSKLTSQSQRVRAKVRKIEEQIHAKQLAATEVQHERVSLSDRLREDYGIELAQLEHEPTDEQQRQREEVQEEIDELRRKINNLGNVNLEALEELEQLELRHKTLSGQHKDLADAKASLERIIDKINTDSRRLFCETLETVRGHFQTLFRDLFGGGHADIVLDEDVDVLESGVEIVARPPGKEPRSISLLSGGEKTLTCVALLLAIFRSRPSPFCVLDEVDAALDEANIDRFIKVLRDFLAWTQFIIVTHSKKTMTCANTIYGVTMQESGVSKQVSVRFEDVSENGEFRQPPDELAGQPEPAREDDETQAA